MVAASSVEISWRWSQSSAGVCLLLADEIPKPRWYRDGIDWSRKARFPRSEELGRRAELRVMVQELTDGRPPEDLGEQRWGCVASHPNLGTRGARQKP